MNCPNLSERLLKAAQLVPTCDTFLDVGTDHAYLPVYLIKKGICKKAIASDLRKGPLESARRTAESFGVLQYTDLRLGSGFETVTPGEANAAVVAGMGGILISELINSSLNTVRQIKTLILQPMTAVYELRKFLYENNFIIKDEILVKEDSKLYHIISTESGTPPRQTESELFMGKKLFDSENPHLAEYMMRQLVKIKKQIDGLEKSKNPDSFKILNEKKKLLVEIKELLERKD